MDWLLDPINQIAAGQIALMLGILIIFITTILINRHHLKAFGIIDKNQKTIIAFLLKDYNDRLTEKADTEPALDPDLVPDPDANDPPVVFKMARKPKLRKPRKPKRVPAVS